MTTRPTSTPPGAGPHEPPPGPKAGEGCRSDAPMTRPASGGFQTTRSASTSPTGVQLAGETGAKAGEAPTSLRAPETLPAPSEFPTARIILPADASEAEWHAARHLGIGGSDVAAILGMNPRWKGPLHVWEEKHGRADHSDSEAAYCGRKLEPVIGEMFSERSGLPITPTPGTLQHVEHDWMLANIDRLVLDGDHVAPLEIKNRSEYLAGEWQDDVPDVPALQAHWYLAVTGYTHAYVAALIGGNRLRWYRLERDDELIEHLVTYCGDWWLRHVVEGVPPRPDGSRATTELLAHLFDVAADSTREVDPVEHTILVQQRRELKAHIAAFDADLAEVENQMKAALGTAEVALLGGRPLYTWRQNGNFAEARFREAEPELAAEYVRLVPAVDTQRLAADHPETYRKYRARRLVVPSEGTTS